MLDLRFFIWSKQPGTPPEKPRKITKFRYAGAYFNKNVNSSMPTVRRK